MFHFALPLLMGNTLYYRHVVRYRITAPDIDAPGRQEFAMGRKIINNEMNIPASSKVVQNELILTYFTAEDEGFPLSKFIMRPCI
jgi:hypothetical protein